ncbi:transposase [Micromonospora sp. NPDC005806]|uniref:transposase n=1 Tax=Micromonospora sp. NPDC005806 TaxID=3364234 RepID=UPI003685DE1C
MGEQPPWIVSDELWGVIAPLLPTRLPRRHRFPGRKPLDDRKVLWKILFVLYNAIPWEYVPQELGFGSGMTCWRRLRDRNEAEVWQQLHEVLLDRLQAAGQLPCSDRRLPRPGAQGRPKPDRDKPGGERGEVADRESRRVGAGSRGRRLSRMAA